MTFKPENEEDVRLSLQTEYRHVYTRYLELNGISRLPEFELNSENDRVAVWKWQYDTTQGKKAWVKSFVPLDHHHLQVVLEKNGKLADPSAPPEDPPAEDPPTEETPPSDEN